MTRRAARSLLLPLVLLALGAIALAVLPAVPLAEDAPGGDVTAAPRSPEESRATVVPGAPRLQATRVETSGDLPGRVPTRGDDQAPHSFQGLVLRAEDGGPLSGAKVVFRPRVTGCRFPELEPDPIVEVSGTDGGFDLPQGGSWDVVVRAADRVTLEGSVLVRDGELHATPDRAVFRVSRGRRIRGRVSGPAGVPPAGTDLTVDWLAEPVAHAAWFRARTDADGWFELGPLPLGRPFVVTVTEFEFPSFCSLPVQLTDQDPGPIQVPWAMSTSLEVRVLDSRGLPAEDLWVELHPGLPRGVFQEDFWKRTGLDGAVVVEGLAHGSYLMQVTHWETDEVLHQETLDLSGAVPSPLVLRLDRPIPPPTERPTLSAPAQEQDPEEEFHEVAVRARFQGPDGQALSVLLLPIEETAEEVRSNWPVTVESFVPVGEREEALEVRDPAGAQVLVAGPGVGARLVALERVAAEGTVVLDQGRRVRGRLLTSEGRPIPFFPMEAGPDLLRRAEEWGDRNGLVRRTWTDAQGWFGFEHLTREALRLCVGTEEFDGRILDEKVLPAGAWDVDLGVLVIPGW